MAVAVPSFSAAMIEGASSGVTCSYSVPLGATSTNGPRPQNRMHPTLLTSTSASSPVCRTAASKPSLTAAEPEDRHPAAVQHRI